MRIKLQDLFMAVTGAILFALPVSAASNAFGLPLIGALTPPPKEWAMFPDEPGTQPAAAQTPANAAVQANTPKGSAQNTPGVPVMGSVVSTAVAQPAPKRDLPVVWLMLTGLLSLGAVLACGNLILKKEEIFAQEYAPVMMVAGVPVVSDEQEIA